MVRLARQKDYTSGMGVNVTLPRGLARHELEAAINRVLSEDYARELWTATCRAELDDVTDDNHYRTGDRVVDGFSIGSCIPNMALSVRFGDFHWERLRDPRSTYGQINFGCVELQTVRWGMCCARHELGRPELRPRSLTAGHGPNQAAKWFIERLIATTR